MKRNTSSRFRKMIRRLAAPIRSSAFILLYHRIATLSRDPLLLAVSPSHFEEHLQILRKWARPLNLRALNEMLQTGKIPRRGVVITFDDGYADNLQNALPLAAKHDVAGNVFVSSAYLKGDREFWWDELERIAFNTAILPDVLQLNIGGLLFEWKASDDDSENGSALENNPSWNILETENPSARHRLYRLLLKHCAALHWEERHDFLDRIRIWAGDHGIVRASHRPLLEQELRLLEASGLFNIGAHTHTHSVLSTLSMEAQKNEITNSKKKLEDLLDHPVISFAYPFGGRKDYTAETVQLVRASGFACACSNFPGLIRRYSDGYQLPRLLVRDWDGDRFARQISEWFYG